MPLGAVCRKDLEGDEYRSWFSDTYSSYSVDGKVIDACLPQLDGVSFRVVFGRWCGDTRRQLPPMIKVLDALYMNDSNCQMVEVDRSKRSDAHNMEGWKIETIPMLIVMCGNEEIGRVEEAPVQSWESDLLLILSRHRQAL